MNCKEASELISAGLDHTLTPEEATQLQQHLEQCETCRQLQAFYQTLDATVSSLDEDPPERMAEGILYQIAPEKKHRRNLHFTGTAIAAVAAVFLLLLGTNRLQFPEYKSAGKDSAIVCDGETTDCNAVSSLQDAQEYAAPGEDLAQTEFLDDIDETAEAKSVWNTLPEFSDDAPGESAEEGTPEAIQLPTLVLQEIPAELADLEPVWTQKSAADVQDLIQGANIAVDFVAAGRTYSVACYEVDFALLQTLSQRYQQEIQFPGDMQTGNIYVILPQES